MSQIPKTPEILIDDFKLWCQDSKNKGSSSSDQCDTPRYWHPLFTFNSCWRDVLRLEFLIAEYLQCMLAGYPVDCVQGFHAQYLYRVHYLLPAKRALNSYIDWRWIMQVACFTLCQTQKWAIDQHRVIEKHLLKSFSLNTLQVRTLDTYFCNVKGQLQEEMPADVSYMSALDSDQLRGSLHGMSGVSMKGLVYHRSEH